MCCTPLPKAAKLARRHCLVVNVTFLRICVYIHSHLDFILQTKRPDFPLQDTFFSSNRLNGPVFVAFKLVLVNWNIENYFH